MMYDVQPDHGDVEIYYYHISFSLRKVDSVITKGRNESGKGAMKLLVSLRCIIVRSWRGRRFTIYSAINDFFDRFFDR